MRKEVQKSRRYEADYVHVYIYCRNIDFAK